MPHEITIPWAPVKALLHLAGKDDIREWVNCVCIDRRGPHLVVWATTGIVLGAIRTEEPSTDGPDICLPRHVLEACKGFDVQATVRREDDGRMSISCMGATHYWQDKGFVAVDWRRVFPKGAPDGRARQFDPALLAPFIKVREVLRGKKGSEKFAGKVLIAHSGPRDAGTDALLVTLMDCPEFAGVLMPLNWEQEKSWMRIAPPEWVHLHARAAAVAGEEVADLV